MLEELLAEAPDDVPDEVPDDVPDEVPEEVPDKIPVPDVPAVEVPPETEEAPEADATDDPVDEPREI